MIKVLLRNGSLRLRQADFAKINSLIHAAETNARVIQMLVLNEDSATPLFRELYESIRQLGDAEWWLEGYEPTDHETSLESLKHMDIKDKISLNSLDRFRKIRNDANYRGYRVPQRQAEEILTFWKGCSGEIISKIKSRLKMRL